MEKVKGRIMRRIYVLLFAVFVSGCAGAGSLVKITDAASNNRGSLSKIAVGMDKEQVMDIMGRDVIQARCCFWRVPIANPYKTEILQGQGKSFEVLYYFTDAPDTDCRIDEENLTPLVFLDGEIIGWGDGFMREVTVKYGVIP